jgi:hypothetical protein
MRRGSSAVYSRAIVGTTTGYFTAALEVAMVYSPLTRGGPDDGAVDDDLPDDRSAKRGHILRGDIQALAGQADTFRFSKDFGWWGG